MTTQMTIRSESEVALHDLEITRKYCSALLKTPHYAKLGEIGIFAVVQKAKSIGMDPLDALNGGMYFVQGKVEMQGQSMMALIRSKGHSVALDPKSTNTHVIMHGKRCDNGDTWTVEFGIEDAKRAGIYRGQWEKYPKVMCMWRCVSTLGRFLFSDILKGVYVQGEISESIGYETKTTQEVIEKPIEILSISPQQISEFQNVLEDTSEEYKRSVRNFLMRYCEGKIENIRLDTYVKLKPAAEAERSKFLETLKVETKTEELANV